MKSLKSEQGFSHLAILLVILVLGVVGFAGWRVYQNSQADDAAEPTNNAPAAAEPEEEPDGCEAPEGYSTYTNEDIGFCFAYPEDWGDVALHEGVIDADYEPAGAFRGSFSANENASFGIVRTDWEYSGPGRGGPNSATGFTSYQQFESDASTPDKIILNNDEKQLVAFNTMFNFDGVIIQAKRKFVDTPNYAGIEFNLNVETDGSFDTSTDEPDELITEAQETQMQTVLDSVTEL